jgi:mono/diheme cytochrome c family protein
MTTKSFLIFSLLFTGCGNYTRLKTQESLNQTTGKATIAFAEVQEKIFSPYCVSCHSNYRDFRAIKQNLSLILSSIEQNRMPKNANPLAQNLKDLLRAWIAEGAQEVLIENEDDPQDSTDDTSLIATWDSLNLKVFGPKCLICHNPIGQAPWIDFSNRTTMAKTLLKHINFKAPEESNLIIRLQDPEEPMPPLPPQSNIPQLTKSEIQTVIDWIHAGLP